MLFKRWQSGVGELTQPLRIRLFLFGRHTHQSLGVAGHAGIEAGGALDEDVGEENLAADFNGLRHFLPGGGVLRLQLGIGVDGLAQLLFGLGLLRHQRPVVQSALAALVGLQGIFNAEDIIGANACVFRRLRGKIMQRLIHARQAVNHIAGLEVLQEVQLSHGEQALGASGMTADEDQFARFCPLGRPLQVVLQLHRLVVFINAEVRNVEVVAGILEVVAITAEEGHLRLRGKNHAHVGVLLVLVQVVHAAGVEGYDVTAQAALLATFLLDGAHLLALGLGGVGVAHAGLGRALHLGRHIRNLDELVELKIGTLALFGLCFGVEAVLDVVLLLGGELLQADAAHVMIGEGQAVFTDERSRAAVVEAHRAQAQMIEPRVGDGEVVIFLDLILGGLVVQPHALIGE